MLTSSGNSTIKGQIVDEMGTGIVDATVQVGHTDIAVKTDAQGNFSVIVAKGSGPWALSAHATGYAVGNSRPASSDANIRIFLRAADVITSVVLPTDTNAIPPAVTVQKNGGTAQLALPMNSLVDSDGNVVSGTVVVSLTYWDGTQQHNIPSNPGPMMAKPSVVGGDLVPLVSLGMVDIEVSQNGNLLQVKSGFSLPLQITTPPSLAALMLTPGVHEHTSLYYLDTQVALWEKVYALDSNGTTYNPNTQTFSANLPHLSAWNFDDEFIMGATGCVTGAVTDCDGNPLGNHAITVYAMGFEGLGSFDVNTSGTGTYCVNIPVPYDQYVDNSSWQVPIHLSDYHTPSASNVNTSVIPQDCETCALWWPQAGGYECYCNIPNAFPGDNITCEQLGCAWGTTTGSDLHDGISYADVNADALVNLVTGTSCPNGCQALPTLKIGAACNGASAPTKPGSAPPTCSPLPEGSACDMTVANACCSSTLQCLDNLCVPPSN